MKINWHKVAVRVAQREELLEEVNIAQIKEIIKHTIIELKIELKKLNLEELIKEFNRIK